MSFDPTVVSRATATLSGDSLRVAWTSSAPAGTVHQVYIDRRLAWHGTARSCLLPWPSGPIRVDVGAVGVGESATDFSASLATGQPRRAALAWKGGTYLSPTLARFDVFASPSPGAAVSYAKPAGSVAAYDAGLPTDGYGMGGYGSGGYGRSASDYEWSSGPLAPGTWTFAVVAVDAAGNVPASHVTTTVAIAGPPNPPAPNAAGKRLTYAYNSTSRVVTLGWLASP